MRAPSGRRAAAAPGLATSLLACAWIVLVSACGPPDAGRPEGGVEEAPGASSVPLLVYTVNYPLAYFARRIAGDMADVRLPAPPGVDPALWSPDAETVSAYQAADLILLNGAGYAAWVDRVSLPAARLVTTAEGATDRFIVEEDAVTHSHGPQGEHAHGEIAFTTWLDAGIAVEQARAIRNALVSVRPVSTSRFDRGFRELERDLIDLDQQILALVAAHPDRLLLASHPVYQYLAARYGLSLRSVHFEPDELPGASDWRELSSVLADHPARWMLWETEPSPATATRLRELGVEGVVFDPVGKRPAEGDYLSIMADNVRNLEKALADASRS